MEASIRPAQGLVAMHKSSTSAWPDAWGNTSRLWAQPATQHQRRALQAAPSTEAVPRFAFLRLWLEGLEWTQERNRRCALSCRGSVWLIFMVLGCFLFAQLRQFRDFIHGWARELLWWNETLQTRQALYYSAHPEPGRLLLRKSFTILLVARLARAACCAHLSDLMLAASEFSTRWRLLNCQCC